MKRRGLPAASRSAELFVTGLNSVVFGVCDLVDKLLCPVFRFLDWQLDKNSTPCHCRYQQQAGPSCEGQIQYAEEALDFWTVPSHTLYGRKKWGQQAPRSKSRLDGRMSDDIGAVSTEKNSKSGSVPGLGLLSFVTRWKMRLRPRGSLATTSSTPHEEAHKEQLGVRKTRSRKSVWSDCGCETCTLWLSKETLLYVHVDGVKDFSSAPGGRSFKAQHDVLFIHGYLSSSSFWVDTVLPHLSEEIRSSCRLFAVDVLGFGKSPRPDDCLYTNGDHVDMIQRSVLSKYGVEKFHLVAHSMGCTIAVALAGQDPTSVLSITLLAPLYFPTRPGVPPASYVLSNVAPKTVWPFFGFVHSLMSWYEHLGRVVCLVFCKHHKFWIPILAFVTKLQGSRMPYSFLHDYMQHNHNSAFKMFHNTICSGPFVMEHAMSRLEKANLRVLVIHGEEDATCPVDCGVALSRQYANVILSRIPGADHMSVVLGREQELAGELEAEILRA